MSLFGKKKHSFTGRSRNRQSGQLGTRIASTLPYSESMRPIRTEVNNQSRVRNSLRQIETINQSKDNNLRRWTLLIGLIIVLAAILVGLSISSRANVVIIQPSGFSYLPHTVAQYQYTTSQAIDSSIFNKFKPTLSSDDVASILSKKYPEIAYAAVTVPLFGFTPTVHIQLSKPILIYAVDNASSYLVNDKGYIVASTHSVPVAELKDLPQVDTPNGASASGSQVLTPDSVIFIETVRQALGIKGVQISKMDLVPMAEELDVYPLGVPYFIKFNLNQTDALSQVGTYLATIATLKQQNVTPSQYVDVRLDGRAYYK
ncbi:MAG: hypothetical protein ACREF7_03550 [Candidatus Saccharimonadales bacterium]